MVKDLEELAAFLKICRKQGVTDIKFAGFSVIFGDVPKKRKDGEIDSDDTDVPTDELTPEQLMFYSAGVPGQ